MLLCNTHPCSPRGIKPKCSVRLLCVRDYASRLKAAQALAAQVDGSVTQAAWFIKQLPQDLAVCGCETFHSVVMDEEEAKVVDANLSPFFCLSWSSASKHILPFGNFPPWKPYIPAQS